ncbi:probable serine/threonine-protein kinase clkA [Stegodyphus dumicola]|uniref:probable serine/threonine-protein kinase clkA n=1 Tax=Stegodyphus dumicola TaxID=202533 RepID=UPI0015A93DF0|nr:probable serine/threonine-protein kinase clkA [Stegodyphus dumicola]
MLNLTRQISWPVDDKQDANHDNEAYTQIVIKGKESRNKDSQRNYETLGTAIGKLFYSALLNLLQSSPYVSNIFNENVSNLKEKSLAVFLIRNALKSDYGDEIANESATACGNTLSKVSSRSKASGLLKDIVNCLTFTLDKYDLISTDKTFQQATYIGHKINKSLYDMLKKTTAFQLDEKNRKFNHSLFTDSKEKKYKIQESKIAYNYIKNEEASIFTTLSSQTENNENSNRTDYFSIYNTSVLKHSTQGFADNLQQSSTESSIEKKPKKANLQTQKGQQIVKKTHSINYLDDYYSDYADYYYSNYRYHESDEMASNNDEQVHQIPPITNSSNIESTEMKSNLQIQGKKTVQKSQIINDKQYNYPKNDYLNYFNNYYLNYDLSDEVYNSKANYLNDYYFNYYNPFYDYYYYSYYYPHYPESEEISYNGRQQHPYTDTNPSNAESIELKSNLQTQGGQKTSQKFQIISDKQYYYPPNDYLNYFNDYYLNYDLSDEVYNSMSNYLNDYYFNYYKPFYDYYYYRPHYPESEEMISYNSRQQHSYTDTNRSNAEFIELKSNLQTQGGQKTFQKFQIISDKQCNYPKNNYLNYFNDYYLSYDLSDEVYNSMANYLNDYYFNYYNPFYDYYYYHPHYLESEEIMSYNGREQHPYTDTDRSNTESSEMKQQPSLQTQEQTNFQKPYIFKDIQYNYPDYDYSNYYYFDNYRAKYDYSYSDFKNYYFSNYYNYPKVYQPGYNFYADNYDTTYNEEHLNQEHNLDHSDNTPEWLQTLQLNLQQQHRGDKSKQFSDKSENPEPWAAASDYNSIYFIHDFYNENYEIPPQNDKHLHQYKNIDYPDIGLGLAENLQFILQLLSGFNRNQFSIQYENPVSRPPTCRLLLL